jgi:hypothetical protein
MLVRKITYENFDGEKVTEPFSFHMSMDEFFQLTSEFEGTPEEVLKQLSDNPDPKALLKQFKKIILMAYGVRSEDGKRFIKSDQLSEEFSQTAAYDSLFFELATEDNALDVFFRSIISKDLLKKLEEAEKIQNVQLPPVPGGAIKEQ